MGPFAVLAATALWVWEHETDLAPRITAHWPQPAAPDGAIAREPASVIGLLGASLLTVLMLRLAALGIAHASRRSELHGPDTERTRRQRSANLWLLLVAEYLSSVVVALPLLLARAPRPVSTAVVATSMGALVLVCVALAIRHVVRDAPTAREKNR